MIKKVITITMVAAASASVAFGGLAGSLGTALKSDLQQSLSTTTNSVATTVKNDVQQNYSSTTNSLAAKVNNYLSQTNVVPTVASNYLQNSTNVVATQVKNYLQNGVTNVSNATNSAVQKISDYEGQANQRVTNGINKTLKRW